MKFSACLMCVVGLVTTVAARADDNKEVAAAWAILEKAESWDLLSLDTKRQKVETKDGFHEWKVLGRITIKDAPTRRDLLAALKKGIAEDEERKRKEREEGRLTATGCFQPRHGVRATHEGKTVEFLICFECTPARWIIISVNGKPVSSPADFYRLAGAAKGPLELKIVEVVRSPEITARTITLP